MSKPLDASWLDAFVQVFERCRIASTESVVVLAEQGSKAVLVEQQPDRVQCRRYVLQTL